METLKSIITSVVSNLVTTPTEKQINVLIDNQKLNAVIDDYVSRQEAYNEICSMGEEIDFEEFANIASGELEKRIRTIIEGKTTEQRERAKSELTSYVCGRVAAKTPESKRRVDQLLSNLINLTIDYFRQKNSDELHVLANDVADDINNQIQRAKEEIISTLGSQTQEMEVKRSPFFGKNAESRRAASPYAYNARTTVFVRREKELQYLHDFLDNEAQCLWMCLYGGASIGKKRLVYQLFEELDQNGEWGHTRILTSITALPEILKAINKSTVICLEYSSERLQAINDFLIMAKDRFFFEQQIKIRVILLEREPVDFSENSIARADDMLELERCFYQNFHLDPLDTDAIRELISSYTSDSDTVMSEFRALDPTESRITLAFLAADQKEDKANYNALEYWYRNECDKIRSLRNTLSFESIRKVLVYATMIGGGELQSFLKSLRYAETLSDWERVFTKLGYYESGKVLPVEPGVLGEYFCMQTFNESKASQALIDRILEEDIYSASSFFERLFLDYDIEQFSWSSKITFVRIPDSHTRIPSWVFKGKHFVHSVMLGEGVVEIGRSAFQGCCNLKTITIMPMLEIISLNAFRDCHALKEVCLNDKADNSALRRIGRKCFKGCTALSNVELPPTCAEIEEQAFYRCESLKKIDLPEKLGVISSEMFAYCFSLEGINIKSKCREIGTSAFHNAKSLKYVKGASQVTAIRSTAFKGCKSLVDLPLFENTEYINTGAFDGDTSLVNVDLSKSQIRVVNKRLFYQCTELQTVFLPDGIRTIGESAFEGDNALITVSPIEDVLWIGKRAFYNCSALCSFEFLPGIQYLGPMAVNGCRLPDESYQYKSIVCFSGLFTRCVTKEQVKMLSQLDKITALKITSGVEKIEEGAFKSLSNLKEIDIENVDSIGKRCFSGCKNLQKVRLNVREIGNDSFNKCCNLSYVNFGHDVKVIGDNAFAHCVNLERIDWPAGHAIQRIGRNALTSTSIRRLPYTKNICGFSFSSFGKNEIEFLQRLENVSKLIVPRTIISLSRGAFQRLTKLKEVRFEGNISHLPDYAFAECDNLERIIPLRPFRVIGNKAFQGCKKLKTFCAQNDVAESVLGKGVFSGCELIESIKLNPDMETIPQYTFFECKSLNIDLPKRLRSIGNYAFAGCDQLTSIRFSGTTIGYGAFKECSNLKTVDLIDSRVTEIKNDAFQENNQLQEVLLPLSVEKIGSGAFKGCSRLEEISLPTRVREIGTGAFQNCKALREIYIPDNVRVIQSHAFRGCYSLKRVSGLMGLVTLGPSAFYQCVSLAEISLQHGIDTIGNAAFFACNNLQSITMPGSLRILSESLFERCGNLKKIQLHEGITSIPNNFAKDCFLLEQVEIPSQVSALGAGAFRNCELLPEVNLPEGITKIPASAFFGCKSLRAISLPSTLRQIMKTAFYKCYQLQDVEIKSEIKWIGPYAFAHNQSMRTFQFAKVKGEIGDAAFMDCNSLQGVQFGTISSIGSGAFSSCNSLESIEITGISTLSEASFRRCESLRNVKLGETVTCISESAFRECRKLSGIYILADSIEIQENAFCDCESLKIIELPESKTVHPDAFINCPAQKYVMT